MDASLATHIESRDDKCGGRPCIAGTRIRVQDVYVWHELQGQSPDEIAAMIPGLTLGQVHAALAYYYDHADAVRSAAADEAEWAKSNKTSHSSRLAQKLAGNDDRADSLPS